MKITKIIFIISPLLLSFIFFIFAGLFYEVVYHKDNIIHSKIILKDDKCYYNYKIKINDIEYECNYPSVQIYEKETSILRGCDIETYKTINKAVLGDPYCGNKNPELFLLFLLFGLGLPFLMILFYIINKKEKNSDIALTDISPPYYNNILNTPSYSEKDEDI